MKRFAVSYISFFDNELHVDVVEAENFVEAIRMLLQDIPVSTDTLEWFDDYCIDLNEEELKEIFFNSDSVVAWKDVS